MTFNFSYVSVSDIHLGHPHTTAEEIVVKLKRYINTDILKKVDAVFIGGDTFDKGLMLSADSVIEAKRWITDLLRQCKKHNVKLRVLEGTPSHDRGQPVHFTELNDLAQIGCDVRYVKTLSIEVMEEHNCSILYVPDEWKPDTDETWLDVTNALALAGLDKVDYAIMHGTFEYQLPEIVKSPKHKEDRYLSVVRRIINIGHIHTASNRDRIYSNGSFDRLGHGYESPKGYWLVESKGNNDKVTFIENKEAKIYRDIDCRGITLEEALNKVAQQDTTDNPAGSRFRILANADDPILGAVATIVQKYSLYFWKAVKDDTARKQRIAAVINNSFTPIHISSDNIISIVEKRLLNKNVDPVIANVALSLLETGRHL